MCLNGFGGQGAQKVETPLCVLSSGAGGGEGGQGRLCGCGWEEDEKLESRGTISHQASYLACLVLLWRYLGHVLSMFVACGKYWAVEELRGWVCWVLAGWDVESSRARVHPAGVGGCVLVGSWWAAVPKPGCKCARSQSRALFLDLSQTLRQQRAWQWGARLKHKPVGVRVCE